MKLKQKYIKAVAKRIHPHAKMKSLNKLSVESLKALHHAFLEMEQKIKDLNKERTA